jgi:hypothetical protein
MVRQKSKFAGILQAGAAAGTVITTAALLNYGLPRLRQLTRQWALDRAYRKALHLYLDSGQRMVIFSDHHKGARDRADDFQHCEQTYLAALDYYHALGYGLVILGDAEELWEQPPQNVIAAYENVFASEARFYPGRYWRVYGNHDNLWRDPVSVQHWLDPFFPGITIHESLLLAVPGLNGDQKLEIFMIHGHQGTLDSDLFDFFPPLVLPMYRELQNLTGLGRTTPAQDACLRSLQDTQMYRWVRRRVKTILIAGHTHRPVWSSLTHLENLLWKLHNLLELPPEAQEPDHQAQVEDLLAQIKLRETKTPPCDDTLKSLPCYFNTGCCRYEDGDITGIEIENGVIRLVKWGHNPDGGPERVLLEQGYLAALWAVL